MPRIGTGLLRFSAAFLLATTALAQGAASTKAAASHKSSPGKPVIWPAGEMKWVDAANSPPGVQQVVLWGDPTKGRFGAMTRFPAGFVAPLHSHSATLRLVVVSGTVIHGPAGKPEVRLGPGSYLVDPAGYKHTTACDKASECVFFMEGDGKFDIVMAATK